MDKQEGEKKNCYYFKDFETGKIRFTRAPFTGWTPPTGIMGVPYAVFSRRSDCVLVPLYLLTRETRERLPEPPKRNEPTDA